MSPNWLIWARELQALAQTGLAYTKDQFDRDRYTAIQRVAARMMAEGAGVDLAEIEKIFAAERGYATPKVGVRAAVFREDGAILMVREMTDGRWALPGRSLRFKPPSSEKATAVSARLSSPRWITSSSRPATRIIVRPSSVSTKSCR